MKKILIILISLVGNLVAQENIIGGNNSGGSNNNRNSYSVGEIFIGTVAKGQKSSSGIMGTFTTLVIESKKGNISSNQEDVDFIYPNPTPNSIKFSKSHLGEVVHLLDLNGRILLERKLDSDELDLSNLPIGHYLLKYNDKTVKIVKI
jgi:hypothetical protein